MIARSSGESRLSTSRRSFGFEDGVEVACGDDRGPILAIDKSAETGPAGAALEGASWVDDEFVICADDDVAVWFNRDSGDGDGNGDEARPLKGKCARTRGGRLVVVG